MRVTSCSTRSSPRAAAAAYRAGLSPVKFLTPKFQPTAGDPRNENRRGEVEVLNLRVRDPSGGGYRHGRPGPEQRETRIKERLFRAAGHHDVIGVDGPPAGQEGQVFRRRGAQLEDPLRRRVVRLPLLDGPDAGVRRNRRRGEVRLARAQVDDVLACRPAPLRLLRNRDRGRRLEVLEVGGESLGHAPRYPRTVSARNGLWAEVMARRSRAPADPRTCSASICTAARSPLPAW